MATFFFYLVMTLFIVMCLFMILLVLIQKGRGGGLSSAFGGAGGSTAFGSKTGDVLTWATSICFGVFLLLAITLNLMTNRNTSGATSSVLPVRSMPPLSTPAPASARNPAEAPAATSAPAVPPTKPAAVPAVSIPSTAPSHPAASEK